MLVSGLRFESLVRALWIPFYESWHCKELPCYAGHALTMTLTLPEQKISYGDAMISQLQMITIYVSDLDRALEFYTAKLGFVKTAEFNDGKQHLVWVVPAAAAEASLATEIALFAPPAGDPRIGAASGVVFTARDIAATYAEMKARGVLFSQDLVRHPYGAGGGDQEARFVDPDGNEFLLHT
jgi:catechol 2,3-dioxygenase-like lactoylglutathione lyase family enzyme